MDSIPCDIVILPEPAIAEQAIAASQRLTPFSSLFTLKDGMFYPHASLYMLQLKIEDLDKVGGLLAGIARQFAPIKVKAKSFEHHGSGFIDVEYPATPQLADLQQQVLTAINPIRDGMREKDWKRMESATGLAFQNFQDYGYPNVGELFRPHITLTRLSRENGRALRVLDNLSGFDGAFVSLGLFEMGNSGTCVRKIKEYELGV